MRDINAHIAADFANPLIRAKLVFYPEESGSFMGEAWQAKKWRADNKMLDQLTPMIRGTGTKRFFYVNELTQCIDDSYIIPLRWVVRDKVMTCDAFRVAVVSTFAYSKKPLTKNH